MKSAWLGNSPAADYYQEILGEDEKDDLIALFEFLAECDGQLRNKKKIRNEGEKLFAFKPKPHRFMAFFVKGKTVILTHGFEKKQERLPPNEKKKAKAYRSDYDLRNTEGNYYDEETERLREPFRSRKGSRGTTPRR